MCQKWAIFRVRHKLRRWRMLLRLLLTPTPHRSHSEVFPGSSARCSQADLFSESDQERERSVASILTDSDARQPPG